MNLNGIKLTWLGHATFRLETPAGKTIIVDPWVMGNPKCPDTEKNVKKVDVLLCTHGHFDHIGDAVEIAKKYNPVVVAIPELAHWLGKKGVKQVSEMNKGGTQAVGDIKVTMVHADHSCGITDGDQIVYGGEACGFVIEFSNGVQRHGHHSRPVRAADCHDSYWRPLHYVAARSRLRLQSSQAEDGNPHALRNFSGVNGQAR